MVSQCCTLHNDIYCFSRCTLASVWYWLKAAIKKLNNKRLEPPIPAIYSRHLHQWIDNPCKPSLTIIEDTYTTFSGCLRYRLVMISNLIVRSKVASVKSLNADMFDCSLISENNKLYANWTVIVDLNPFWRWLRFLTDTQMTSWWDKPLDFVLSSVLSGKSDWDFSSYTSQCRLNQKRPYQLAFLMQQSDLKFCSYEIACQS